MARAGGKGVAPVDPAQRRRKSEPARGEWVDLPPLERAVLPALPRRSKKEGGPWPAATRRLWEAWRKDPVTQLYSQSDIAFAVQTIYLHAKDQYRFAAEIRLRSDELGLNPKGKRDLRWRVGPVGKPRAAAQAEKQPKAKQQGASGPARTSADRQSRLSVVK